MKGWTPMKSIIKFAKDLDLKELIRVQKETEAEEREYLGIQEVPKKSIGDKIRMIKYLILSDYTVWKGSQQ